MSFQNIYFKRATATSRACYVCYKPTATCLATTNAVDFIYTCDAHLSDPGFATEIVDPNAPKEAVVSKEEIARVKAEWEAKEEARKKKDNKGKKSSDKSPSPSSSVPGSLPPIPAASSSGTTLTHKRYSLHRDFYAMRQAEHRQRRQAKQMQELAPRLPGAPRGSPIG
ncbi:VPS4-associated protein 1 [Lactarius sanguifluus]|nr:VPS4-associated protein 1 [Lactarius sanguifluus]